MKDPEKLVPYLSMEEVDAVEVYGAIEMAVKVYEMVGDAVLVDHYKDLLRRFKAIDGSPMSVEKLNAMLEEES